LYPQEISPKPVLPFALGHITNDRPKTNEQVYNLG
jgi:hypothetical protein